MSLSVQNLGRNDLSPELLAAWRDLERRAIETNAYLCADFLVPSLQCLDPTLVVRILAVWHHAPAEAQDRRLVGLGVFSLQAAQRRRPFPVLTTYVGAHGYLSGVLLEASCADAVAEALLRALLVSRRGWGALQWSRCRRNGADMQALVAAAQRLGLRPRWLDAYERAVLEPRGIDEASLRRDLGGKRLKELRRQQRRLAEAGTVGWSVLRSTGPAMDQALERFVELEGQGWKAGEGSALACKSADVAFFRTMAQSMAERGAVFITELRLEGRVVASTFNLVAGDRGFAFKIGWDPALTRYGVGMLNEFAMLEAASTHLADLSSIDSGTSPGSFIEQLWGRRDTIADLVIPVGLAARLYFLLRDQFSRRRRK
jgi:CelD/BcsL family acetyltransferase involved in cellulose biosynthesis